MASFTDWMFGTSGDAISDATKRQTGLDTAYEGKINTALAPYEQLSDLQGATDAQKAYTSGLMDMDTDQYKVQQANLNNQVELYKTLGGGLKVNTNDTVTPQPSSAQIHAAQ